MSKKIQLQVPTPCHENWDNMDPVEQGRFCGSCQKQVVDFSDMSDRQIAEFFKKPSTGSVCGRFMTDQLDREIAIPRKQIPWVKYFFQFALPAFLISLKSSGQSRPTMGKVANVQCVKPPQSDSLPHRMLGEVVPVSTTRTITGKVTDEKGEPISLANVSQRGKNAATVTNANGFFKISVQQDEFSLLFTSIGFETAEVRLVKNQNSLNVILKASQTETTMGVVCYFPKKQLPKQEKTVQNFILKGTVLEEGSLNPISGASIKIIGSHDGSSANEKGSFDLPLADISKSVKLEVSSIGYEAKIVEYEFHVNAGPQEQMINVELKPVVRELQPLVVSSNIDDRIRKGVVWITYSVRESQFRKTKINREGKFRIFPNPVQSNSTMHIEWKQSEFGYYSLQLLNQSGQLVLNKEIFIDKDARVLSIDVPNVAAGGYFVKMTSKKSGRVFAENIVIQ